MANPRQPVDILIFIEHVARELDIACLIKSLMARRHGFVTVIASLNWDLAQTLKRYQPHAVAVPYCYSAHPEDPGLYEILTVWPQAVCVNLAYEQLHPRIMHRFGLPRDVIARAHVLHHAWGTFHADALQQCGVPAAHIVVNGNPSYALYQPPYRQRFAPRQVLADRYGLDPLKRWVFVPESYGAAFQSDRDVHDLVRRGHETKAAVQHRDFTRASLQEAVRWWQQAADSGAVEVIVRPRPMTPLAAFRQACARAIGRPLSPHLHLIKEETVREWILASHVVVSNASTTLIEAAVADQPIAMLAPFPAPEFLRADWYDAVPKIDRASAFLQFAAGEVPERTGERLKEWARQQMLSCGDPIANLADLLASVVRRARPLPPPVDVDAVAFPAGPFPLIRRGLAGLRRQWRRTLHQSLHEQDRIRPAELSRRIADWEEVVDGMALPYEITGPRVNPRLSVIVCTWNPTPAGLARALDSLSHQQLERTAYEVIVVDNGPLQRARPMVGGRASQVGLSLRSVHEPTLGASAARNRGVRESRGSLVAFLDDDAQAEPGWAFRLLRAYEELPEAACIGGRIVLRDKGVTPGWWRSAFNEACGELDYGSERVRLGYPRYPYAGNLSFRRDVFARVGWFSPALGPVGRRHLDGEEFELCLRIDRAGGAIFFDPGLIVYHDVPRSRLTRRFVVHKGFYHGRTMAMIEASHFGRSFAMWRSVQIGRDLAQRRRLALACAPDWRGSDSHLERWLSHVAMPRQGDFNLKVAAQGLGYGYQTFAHELWRLHPVVPPRAERLG